MNLLVRQIWALIKKNILLTCVRRPISTFIRAFALPLAIVLVIAYSKYFFASPQHWGVSSAHTIRSLKDGLALSDASIVGFIDNGMKGDVANVVDSLSRQVRDAGKTPKSYNSSWSMAQECRTDDKGVSPCYGVVVFLSSPTQGTNQSALGTWNYTLRAQGGGSINVESDKNGVEVDILPLQRALEMEMRVQSNKTTRASTSLNVIMFTEQDQDALDKSRNSNYLAYCIYAFGPIFSFAMLELVYHLTSFVAKECELGMSGLIDTMISGGSNIRGRVVRQISTYISFAMVYFPGWLGIGITIARVVVPKTSHNWPTSFVILSGFALTSWSLFGASFFRKAALSGSIMVIIGVVGGILPVVIFNQTRITCIILSILFPSSNFTYYITGHAVFEFVNKQASMSVVPDEFEGRGSSYRMAPMFHWIILVVHMIVMPPLAFAVEHLIHSTASPYRKFVKPANNGDPTVILSDFKKTYTPGTFARIFKRRKDVYAVNGLDLKAYSGQILCLLGPNGSGKSTTLNCIAGSQKATSGMISIDHTGGLGYAPQHNVIWPDLTVKEHIRIFSDLKCIERINTEVLVDLARGVDLSGKLNKKANTLSGGQKRKLQMAIMFAGGSAVCCVDEVSTGLDPISRRRIWEILLAERGRRTIILTTHYLDEADFLADDIAIMYKGTMRASGTSASLKHTYGDGYTIKLPMLTSFQPQTSGEVHKSQSRHQTVYRAATPALAGEVAAELEKQNLVDYQISGPTMEELFIKITGETIESAEEITEKKKKKGTDKKEGKIVEPVVEVAKEDYKLSEGKPISVVRQWWILLCKRFRILRRRWVPYFVAVAFAIAGAGVAPLLINSTKTSIPCPKPSDLVYDSTYRNDFGSSFYGSSSYYRAFGDNLSSKTLIFGPKDRIDDDRLNALAEVYSVNHTRNYGTSMYGYSNGTQIKNQLRLVSTYDEFRNAIRDDWRRQDGNSQSSSPDYTPYTQIKGGIWLGDDKSKATILVNVRRSGVPSQMLNMYNVLADNAIVSSSYYALPSTSLPNLIDGKPLMFIIYYGLIMACYPVFFTLYPTNERISNVRSMQYSNGIRPIPLWLSHLSFDSIFILVISVIATALLSISTPLWTGLGYIFLILFLYGVASALISYMISMFARTAVTAWIIMALGQITLYFAYFGGIIGVHSSIPYANLEYTMNSLFFGLAIISPVISLERALFIGLQQLATQCTDKPLGSIFMFGGPILYLILQIVCLSAVLLWWDSGFVMPLEKKRAADQESRDMSADVIAERTMMRSPQTDLIVDSVTKSFGSNMAVSDVTFCVQQSEIFALLGPNGAGKSTIISMIRGDIKPSTHESTISIAKHSILTHPVQARFNLGVCPQFDSADVLTVAETLAFFAQIRGVTDIKHNVATVIAACGLTAFTLQLAQNLSGGTKRKLSLAIALVGNPRVLVLDEPSSALDANAKRTLWKCLQTLAKSRAVVLTTHSMEEADALADRIGIVSSHMLALGEREDLKRRAGTQFHVHLVAASAPRTTPQELAIMKDWAQSTFEHVKISRETQGGQLRFEIPAEGWSMGGLLKVLEENKARLGVEFYNVGRATLDEVFEAIVKREGDTEVLERLG